MENTKTVLSCFSSSGIGELSFQKLGLKVLVSNELLQDRCDLYKTNYPWVTSICGDIWQKENNIITTWKNLTHESPFLMYATPPCQGMSSNGIGTLLKKVKNSNKIHLDPRNRLIIPTVRIAKKLSPKWLFLENVSSMKDTIIQDDSDQFINIIEYIRQELGSEYIGKAQVVNCADYGIPQTRKRLITIFTRSSKGKEYLTKYGTFLPPVTHSEQGVNYTKKWVSLKEAIGNLPPLEAKEGENSRVDFHPWHTVPVMKEEKYFWLTHTPQGETAYNNQCINPKCLYQENPIHGSTKEKGIHTSNKDTPIYCKKCGSLLPRPTMIDKQTKKRRLIKGYDSAYRRMSWSEPSPTLTQNFIFEASDKKVHPTQTRVLSFFEAMKIQTISQYQYQFSCGGKPISKSLCSQIIGESVPPKLVEIICQKIIEIDS